MVEYTANNPQNYVYQLANVFLFISYVAPSPLALRINLAAAGLCFVLWGWIVLPFSIDTVLWNGVFMLINITQAILILWRRRPVHLNADQSMLYAAFFAPGKGHSMSRADFAQLTAEHHVAAGKHEQKKHAGSVADDPASATGSARGLASSGLCYVREYACGEIIAHVGQPSEALSIILSGQVVVEALEDADDDAVTAASPNAPSGTGAGGAADAVQPFTGGSAPAQQKFRPVSLLHAFDFCDSPEWVARQARRAPLFSVQLRVHSPSGARVFHWRAGALDTFLASNPVIQGALLGVVGIDLARKVFGANVDRAELVAELKGDSGAVSAQRVFHTQSPEIPLPPHQRKKSVDGAKAAVEGSQQQQQQQQLLQVQPDAPVVVLSDASSQQLQPPPQQTQNEALVSLLHRVRAEPTSAGVNTAPIEAPLEQQQQQLQQQQEPAGKMEVAVEMAAPAGGGDFIVHLDPNES